MLLPFFHLRRGERCQSLADLIQARDLADPPALRAEAREALQRLLLSRRGEIQVSDAPLSPATAAKEAGEPFWGSRERQPDVAPLRPWLVDLVDDLAAHLDRPLRVSPGARGERPSCVLREAGPDGQPLVRLTTPSTEQPLPLGSRPADLDAIPSQVRHLRGVESQLARLLSPELLCALTPPAGPALTVRLLTLTPGPDGWPAEVTLALPGQPARRQRLTL